MWFFLILLSTVLLQACVPIIVAGAAAGGTTMVLNDQRDIQTIISDKQIQQKILGRFATDPILKRKTHIVIAVLNGNVLASGQAPNETLRNRALKIIQSIPNRRIYDQIEITNATDLQTRAQDALITSKVKTTLFAREGLNAMKIKIVTENKIVYLMGIVSKKQGHLSTEVVRKIPNVKKVVKLFEYR